MNHHRRRENPKRDTEPDRPRDPLDIPSEERMLRNLDERWGTALSGRNIGFAGEFTTGKVIRSGGADEA